MKLLIQLMLLTPVMAASSSPEASSYSSTFGPLWPGEPYCWTKAYHPTVIGTVFITVDQIHNTTAITTVYKTEVSRNGTLSIFTPPTTTNDAGTVTQSKEGVAFAYPTGYTQVAASLTWKAILPTFIPPNKRSCCDLKATTAFLAPTHTAVVGSVDTVDTDDPFGWYHTLFVCPPFDIVLQPAQVSSVYNNRSLAFQYTGCPYTSCDLSYSSALAASAISQEVGIFATSMTTLSSLSSSLLISSVSSRTSVQAIPETLPASTSTSLVPSTTTSAASSTMPSTLPTQTVTTQQGTSTEQLSTTTQPGSEAFQPSPDEQTRSSSPPLPNSSDGQTRMALSTPFISPPPQTPFIPPITLGSTTIQPDTASRFVVGSQTLVPGSSITVFSQIITYPAPITPAPPLPPITIGSQVITASSSVYIIDNQTLVPGATVTVSGTTIQLAATPSQIIVGTDTAALATGNTGGYIWSGLGSSASSTSAVSGSPTPYRGGSSRSTPSHTAVVIAVVACMLWM